VWCGNTAGVYGQTEELDAPKFLAGVYGTAATQPGVIGYSRAGDGVQGATFTGTAIRAASFFGPGIDSLSGGLTGVRGVSGTQGPTVPHPVTVGGVWGSSNASHGVIGTSNANAGVFAYSTNSAGIVGMTSNPAASAGAFFGDVRVAGNIYANNLKSAAVPFPDGSRRAFYCMESPEVWFEDFGSAKLARSRGGKARCELCQSDQAR
jgi:hypothetical protein